MEKILVKISEAAKTEPKTIEQLFMKLIEELGEASQAYLSSENISGNNYKNLNREDVKEELVDTLLVTFSLLYKLDSTDREIENLMNKKIDKWLQKQNN